MTVFPPNPTNGQQVVFSLKTYEWNGSRWISVGAELNASNLVAGTVAVARGGTGSSTAPMMGVITAANAAAAQDVLAGTTVGKAVFTAVDAAAARTAIGSGSGSGSGDLLAANNLSEVNDAASRTNLGLGGSAVLEVGNSAGTVAAGDDSRLSDARTPSSTLDHDADKITTGTLVALRGGTGLTSVSTLLNSNTTKSDVGLSAVENTALTTWAGSGNITSVGTISNGTWSGTAIAYGSLSGTPTLGTASASATGDFEASGAITTAVTAHNNITTAHGISAFGSTLVDDANAAAALVTLGAQPVDADLTAIAGLTSAANKGIQFTGSGSAGVYDLTAAGKALLDDADATAQRLTLGLGTVATTAATAYATAAQGTKADSALQDVVSDTSPQLGGNLDVQARTITTSTSNGNVVIDPPGSGFLQVEGTTNPGKIRLMCEFGTHGVGLISPSHITGANYDLVLPTATGSANQALKTDGSGNLGWSTLGTAATSATSDFVASSAVSTFGATLVDDADAAAARTTLGAAATNHTHTASQLTGDMPDARIVASNVTQHAAQIDVGDLGNVTQAAGLLGAGSALYWNGSAWIAGSLQSTSVPSLPASKITSGQLAVAQGGTGVASLPMVSIPGAADASAARTVLGVTNAGSYTGHIETGSVKEFTLDPTVATSRTITQFYIQSGNQSGSGGGTGAFILKKKSGSTITTLSTASSVSNSSTTQTIAVSSLAANDRLYLQCTTNSSLVDVIFAVEYTE